MESLILELVKTLTSLGWMGVFAFVAYLFFHTVQIIAPYYFLYRGSLALMDAIRRGVKKVQEDKSDKVAGGFFGRGEGSKA